jgi:argininosuccinate lyase
MSVLLVGLGRFRAGSLLWCTSEFNYLAPGRRLRAVQQHHAAEAEPGCARARPALTSKALGQSQAIITAVHNTPFGDIVDTEDDLQPLVFAAFRDATRAVKLVAAAMRTAEFDPVSLERARAMDGRRSPNWRTRWRAIARCRSRPRTRLPAG